MKNRSKRKSMSLKDKQAHQAPAHHSIFEMLVNSLSETRDEEHLVRIIRMTEILK